MRALLSTVRGTTRTLHCPEGRAVTHETTKVEIKVRDDGPLKVTGPVRLIDADGGIFELEGDRPVVLCRCGHSATKPFCDGSHRKEDFTARDRAPRSP
jgi:CDGSH-type Zn-finger protein